MKTLEKIVLDPVRIDIAGTRLEIQPVKVRELPKLFKAIKPILTDLQALFKRMAAQGDADSDATKGFLLEYLASGSDQLVEHLLQATVIASRKDREWVDDLSLDELVLLIGKIVEVNGHFLAHQVMPQLAAAAEDMAKTLGG